MQDVISRPESAAARHEERRTPVLASMCLALVLVVASVSSVNLALAGISVDLRTTSTQLTWIADAYTVALAALVLPCGALGDRFGRRRLLQWGTVVFGVAAAGASLAQGPGSLIACRALMGVGAAMIMPGTLSTITAVYPTNQRARAVSVWAGFASSGAILGLLSCGLILEWWSWRATFVATALLAVVTGWAARVFAPDTAAADEAVIDLPGFLLSAAGIGALVFGIIEGADQGWTTNSAVVGLATAALALGAFVVWERRTDRPMLDVRLFRLGGFSAGTVALTVQFLCMFGFFLVGMQFLLLMLEFSPLLSAIAMLPLGAVVMPLSRLAPHVVQRLGERVVMTFGLAAIACGLYSLSRLDAQSSYWHFLGGLVCFGVGIAFTSTPATTAIVTSLPLAKQGVASAVNDVTREVGSALGIAVLGSLFNSAYADGMRSVTTQLPAEAAHAAGESAGAGLAIADRLGPAGQSLHDAVQVAFGVGIQDALTIGACIAIVAAAFVWWRAPAVTN